MGVSGTILSGLASNLDLPDLSLPRARIKDKSHQCWQYVVLKRNIGVRCLSEFAFILLIR
jgi:hypothetical protein